MKTFLTYLDENSFGPALDKMYPMGDLNAADEKEVKKSDLDQIEKYADKIFSRQLFEEAMSPAEKAMRPSI
jgi:hypothetical protein